MFRWTAVHTHKARLIIHVDRMPKVPLESGSGLHVVGEVTDSLLNILYLSIYFDKGEDGSMDEKFGDYSVSLLSSEMIHSRKPVRLFYGSVASYLSHSFNHADLIIIYIFKVGCVTTHYTHDMK